MNASELVKNDGFQSRFKMDRYSMIAPEYKIKPAIKEAYGDSLPVLGSRQEMMKKAKLSFDEGSLSPNNQSSP